MKRKLEVTTVENSCDKMLKFNKTEMEKMDISDVDSIGGARMFNFKLTDKKARKNLLKSAQRMYLETEVKQNCINLKFSPGTYLLVAKKMIEECEVKHSQGVKFQFKDMEIKVVDFSSGLELNNKHFDTKIVFSVNDQKVVMHCYNSTQNLKVDGNAHVHFKEKFLEPLLLEEIDKVKEQITNYDKQLISTLDTKSTTGPMKGISVKKIRNSIEQNLFTCKTCHITFKNFSSLSIHKQEHSVKSHHTSSSLLPIGNSTRNNSLAHEVLLCEDVTLDNNSLLTCEEIYEKEQAVRNDKEKNVGNTKQSIEVESPLKELNQCVECDFSCYDEMTLKKHHDSVHRQTTLFQCAICEFESTSSSILNNHIQSKHTSKEKEIHTCDKCEQSFPYQFLLGNHICYRCNKCNFIGSSSKGLATHVQATHSKATVQIETNVRFQCELCDYTYKYNIQIKKHMLATHKDTQTHVEDFPCNDCNLSFGNSKYLEEHNKFHHKTAIACSYCGIPLDEKDYQEHMIEFHETSVVLYTIGKQVDELHEKMETAEALKNEVFKCMQNIMNVQNEIKQELFLIRNNQNSKTNEATKSTKEKSVDALDEKAAKSDKEKRDAKNDHRYLDSTKHHSRDQGPSYHSYTAHKNVNKDTANKDVRGKKAESYSSVVSGKKHENANKRNDVKDSYRSRSGYSRSSHNYRGEKRDWSRNRYGEVTRDWSNRSRQYNRPQRRNIRSFKPDDRLYNRSQNYQRSYSQFYRRSRSPFRQRMPQNNWYENAPVMQRRFHNLPRNEDDQWYDGRMNANVMYHQPHFNPSFEIPLANRFSILGN